MWMWLSIFLPAATATATDTCTEGACAAQSAALLQSSMGPRPHVILQEDYRRITPCQDSSAFTPDKDISGWCDMYNMASLPGEAICEATEGCRFTRGYCQCDEPEACRAVGATWNGWTCREELFGLSREYMEKVIEAHVDGDCDGKEVWGYQVKDMMAWPASQCCSDFPSTMCDKNVTAMTPCKSASDFLPEAYSYAWCDLSASNVSKESCDATADCKEEFGSCNCKSQSSCKTLGGVFMGTTCQEELSLWYPGIHRAVAEALDTGSCQGVEATMGDLKSSVDYLGHCCASKKSVCEELENYDSGYSEW